MQARSAGLVSNRWEMRKMILSSFSPKIFVPQGDAKEYDLWLTINSYERLHYKQ